jgi:hypothetical protein
MRKNIDETAGNEVDRKRSFQVDGRGFLCGDMLTASALSKNARNSEMTETGLSRNH